MNQTPPSPLLRIGVSGCFFHRDPTRPLFKDKTLIYWEESLLDWVGSQGALAIPIPRLSPESPLKLTTLVHQLDALILQGGSDVSPTQYGEIPLHADWEGDALRDEYEKELVAEFRHQQKPILGICRGIQLLNVVFGGSLYQDIASQSPESALHRNWEIYDKHFHEVIFENDSRLKSWYGGLGGGKVTSIHHQAIRRLGNGLIVEARSRDDSIIEAVRSTDDRFVVGIQWHPEFHPTNDDSLLPGTPLLKAFSRAAIERRANGVGHL